ncbi:aminotransferase class III-fold pyridoxal phosphate-dependent enzyme [Paramaledivibacter caminithermalis]|uniref:Glutamate-1-semialdehyde 2,1-aminomutase n=1 Tax=Paramaledivibacter caminithermalis (strain DSM 15212 / CIP 107654 / DViRD3) TaxID=1121301 RepID=A0A1M6QVQ5_PARC5|nr:aminotransferase class III-fold pyridoxal phosphate-dependent enzyme [Paramaledivibacter caminithermalis]SHK24349.1 glutamate-1-semialdehyde 2,1-aminomutase [Paramaledivibacter caminithermalis DSM 15212]
MKTYNYKRNRELFQKALKVIPTGIYGHLGPTSSCFIPVDAYPCFASRAKGAYIWDVDGNRFIDYMCAYGPNILGYNDEDVEAAVEKQMKLGNCTTTPFAIMIDMAELLVDTVEMADWAFFAKNGGDVTNFALMVAKAATGRKKTILVKGGYHGVAPWTQKLGYPGIVEEDVANNIYVEWNNYDQVEKIVRENPGEIACFMATPYHHPIFMDNELPKKDYWQKIRKLCTDNGIVLAIDDVRCGFRLDLKGSDHYFGFKADLMCFCKALGNGWNFSALCGIDALKDAVSSVMYTGSYWLSAVPFAAGIACINKLKKINAPKIMKSQGKKLTDGLVDIGKRHGFNLIVTGEPSMWYMRIANDDSLMLHQEWVAECVKRGVFFTNHHNLFMNCAMTDEDIEFTHEVADEAFKVVKARNKELF